MVEYFSKKWSRIWSLIRSSDFTTAIFLREVEIFKRLIFKVSQKDFDERDKQLIRLNADMQAFFGEMALFEKESIRSATVTATEKSRLAVITKENFEELCESYLKLGYTILRNIVQVLVSRLNKANQYVLKLTTAFSFAIENR
ncbi:cyclic nucleotide-binding domain-containing protein [candidate division KSB1 bacterium]